MASFKINYKASLNKLNKDLIADLNKLIQKKELELIGNEIIRQVVGRSRTGKGVKEDGGSEFTFPDLSESYKIARTNLRRRGKLSNLTRPNLSNITLSGALLDSLVLKITGNSRAVVEIPAKQHPNSSISMKDLAEILQQKKGRSFMHLSAKQTKIMESFIKRLIREKIRRTL